MKDIYDIVAESKKRSGQPLALATLVQAEGSSYRRPGARMLICQDGRTVGSLSGGCIEQEIASRARSVLESGKPVTIDFDTRRRFGCHGRIDIFVEKVTHQFFTDLRDQLCARKSCLIVTTPNGSHVTSHSVTENNSFSGKDRGTLAGECGRWAPFIQVVHPPLRLLICGEGPDTVPLRRLCDTLGWESFIVNDVQAVSVEVDRWTAAIVKSHNFGRDFAALVRLLPLNLRYVGLIGPKKRRDQLLNHLLEIGLSINAGFFAPAGLDLNAETPEEIALSIVSEIQRVFAEGSGQSLRDRRSPIHREADPVQSTPRRGWQTSAL